MGKWNIITPKATTNAIKNPSFEVNVTDFWTVITGIKAISTTYQKFGVSSAKVGAFGGSNLKMYSSSTLTVANGETVTISGYGYVLSTSTVEGQKITLTTGGATGTGTTRATASFTDTDKWQRVEASYTNDTGGNLTAYLNIVTTNTTGDFYVDGMQMEIQTAATTYIDGSLDGGLWTAIPHASTSSRLLSYPYGGTVTNFEDDLSYPIQRMQGAGYPQNHLSTQPYSTADGSRFQAQKFGEHTFRLFGTSNTAATSLRVLHDLRQAVIKRLLPTRDVRTDEVAYKIVRYTGASVDKEIKCHFDTGMELNLGGGFHEDNAPLQFIAPDPNFYEVGNTAAVLDVNDSQTFNGIARRTSTGWDMPNGTPTAIGGNSQVWSIAYSANNAKVYVAGDFTNFDGTGANVYLVDGDTEFYSWGLVGSTAPDARVWKVIVGPDDSVFIAGEFTAMGAVANSDAIAKFNGSSWVTVGGGAMSGSGYVYDMAFKENGNLVAVGTFTTIRGVVADRIAEWDGSTWTEIGGGVDNGSVYGVAVAPNGDLYICGDFDSVGGAATFEGVARWDGTAWDNLNGGLDTVGRTLIVRDIQVTKDGSVYAGGDTTTANGSSTTIGYIAKYNGSVWETMAGGVNGVIRRMLPLESGELLVAGDFTAKAAGIQQNLPGLAIWTDTEFLPLDIDALSTPRGLAEIRGDLWVGHGSTSSVQTEANNAISYTGTADAYPVIEITRSGGTSCELRSIINEATGRALYFQSYLLLDGETVTLDLSPENFSMTSSLFGEIPRLLMASSDISGFYLRPSNDGDAYVNNITAFAKVAGSPTITAIMKWRTAFVSID